MKIAFVINSLEGGGAERVASLLLRRLHADPAGRFQFDLILLDEAPCAYAPPEGMPVYTLGARGSLAASVRGVVKAVRRLKPDLIVSFLTRSNFGALAASAVTRTPCVISERVNTSSHFSAPGARSRISKALVRASYPRARKLIAVSEGVAADLAENFCTPRERLVVIHNPYDLGAIEIAGAAPPAVEAEGEYFVAVGRLTANKNFPLLLEAFAASGVTGGLMILGDGEDRAALAERARALGIDGRVRFAGFLDNPYAVMARSRGFVSASNAEGFPNAAAEAMALGLPVVLTDCPSGPAELLEGRALPGAGVVTARHGLLTPVGDAAALASALRMLTDPAVATDLGARARKRMRDFTIDIVAERYAAVFEAAAGR